MEEANTHEHAEDPDYTGGRSTVYRWSKEATDIIVIGVKNGQLTVYLSLVNLLEEKYSSNVSLSAEVRQALNNFFCDCYEGIGKIL